MVKRKGHWYILSRSTKKQMNNKTLLTSKWTSTIFIMSLSGTWKMGQKLVTIIKLMSCYSVL